jgi:membrane protein YdbS with pleckstrin-like domain
MGGKSESELFNPPSLAFRPVSPKLVKVRLALLAVADGALVLAATAVMILLHAWWISGLAAAVLALGVFWAWITVRQVRAIGYAESDRELLIRRGVMFRSMKVVPYGRLQYLDVNAGPLSRAFGLASLRLNTAAGVLNATLPGLEAPEAARLRDRLAALGDSEMAGL